MKLRVRKGLFSWKLVNECNMAVANISNLKFIGAAKKISNVEGTVIFTTNIVNLPKEKEAWNCAASRKYMIYKDGEAVAEAKLAFANNPEQTKAKAFIPRPPQVDKMDVETPYGIWVIQRQKNNSLIITHDSKRLGSITPIFTFRPIYLELSEKYEAAFWAGIYVLAEYMMHEDDLIVV